MRQEKSLHSKSEVRIHCITRPCSVLTPSDCFAQAIKPLNRLQTNLVLKPDKAACDTEHIHTSLDPWVYPHAWGRQRKSSFNFIIYLLQVRDKGRASKISHLCENIFEAIFYVKFFPTYLSLSSQKSTEEGLLCGFGWK